MKEAIVAYDHSPMSKKAVQEAKRFALSGVLCKVHFVSVIKLKSISIQKLRNPQGDGTVVEGDFSREMNKLAENFKENGIQALSELLIAGANENHGLPICQYAEENDMDMIIVGSRGLTNMQSFILGSVSNYVVQNAKCPVLVIK